MLPRLCLTLLVSTLLCQSHTLNAAEQKQIAITIDDLPFVGTTDNHPRKLKQEHKRFMLMLETIQAKKAPVTGFVVAGTIEKDQWQLLQSFADAGLSLGNHTYSHPSLNRVSAEYYIENIAKADKKLEPILTKPKYFRYPYLATSYGQKKQQVLDFLMESDYTVAPVTIDSKDFRYNTQLFQIPYRQRPARLPGLKKRYVDYILTQTLRAERQHAKHGLPNEHILLIHANYINAHAIGDIIDMYRDRGYEIVPLETIMEKRRKRAMKHQLPKVALPEVDPSISLVDQSAANRAADLGSSSQ